MPLLILGAQTCPPSVEGTWINACVMWLCITCVQHHLTASLPTMHAGTLYSLLMSTLNIGGVVADNLGGLLTWIIGVKSNDFTHLWLLVLVRAVRSFALL